MPLLATLNSLVLGMPWCRRCFSLTDEGLRWYRTGSWWPRRSPLRWALLRPSHLDEGVNPGEDAVAVVLCHVAVDATAPETTNIVMVTGMSGIG